MSILISGMDLPHDCDECKLCAFIPVGDYGINRKCMPLNAKAEISIRRLDCPLVPVPKHGDLIDADKLVELCDIMADKCDGIGASIWHQFKTTVEWSPIVIPAEEGE